MALDLREAEQAAPNAQPRQCVFCLGLHEQALRLRYIRNCSQARLIARRELLFRVASCSQFDGRVLCHVNRGLPSCLGLLPLACDFLNGLIVNCGLLAFASSCYLFLRMQGGELHQWKRRGEPDCPIASVKSRSLSVTGECAVRIESAAAPGKCRLKIQMRKIGAAEDMLLSLNLSDSRALRDSQRVIAVRRSDG